jgi:hypothetical protein
MRRNCREWARKHAGDAAIRAGQPIAMRRRARELSSEAHGKGELRPPQFGWRWIDTNRDGSKLYSGRCARCGEEYRKLEKHHLDYSRPLYVEWLCLGCHAVVHRQDLSSDAWLRTVGGRFLVYLVELALQERYSAASRRSL